MAQGREKKETKYEVLGRNETDPAVCGFFRFELPRYCLFVVGEEENLSIANETAPKFQKQKMSFPLLLVFAVCLFQSCIAISSSVRHFLKNPHISFTVSFVEQHRCYDSLLPEFPTHHRTNLTVYLYRAASPQELIASSSFSVRAQKNFISVADEVGRVVIFRKDECGLVARCHTRCFFSSFFFFFSRPVDFSPVCLSPHGFSLITRTFADGFQVFFPDLCIFSRMHLLSPHGLLLNEPFE